MKKLSFFHTPNLIYYALSTHPDLKQEVHTYIFFAPPLAVLTFTDFTLEFDILLDLLCE